MKFFVPEAESPEQAERLYRSIAEFNHAQVGDNRISSIVWRHAGEQMSCKVGGPLPSYYQTGTEPVLAILDCGNLYKVCTRSRGGLRGEAVFVGNSPEIQLSFFDSDET